MRRGRLATVFALAALAGGPDAASGAPGDIDPSFDGDGKQPARPAAQRLLFS
jgi:hypothetical protein